MINIIVNTGRYMDYYDAMEKDDFIVVRHDIEFSIERAYKLALLESEHKFYTSYFVQLANNTYNALSQRNLDLLKAIASLGHHIGLHYNAASISDLGEIQDGIILQADILSAFLDIRIDRFSFHRPSPMVLKSNMMISGLINVYSKEFFTFTEDVSTLSVNDVQYLSDSNHQWKYGQPTSEWINRHQKLQCLFHPLSWSEYGFNHIDCFKLLTQEKHTELITSINDEWKYFHLLEGKL